MKTDQQIMKTRQDLLDALQNIKDEIVYQVVSCILEGLADNPGLSLAEIQETLETDLKLSAEDAVDCLLPIIVGLTIQKQIRLAKDTNKWELINDADKSINA